MLPLNPIPTEKSFDNRLHPKDIAFLEQRFIFENTNAKNLFHFSSTSSASVGACC
jgi:hypothetical protein